ncbi:MAG: hypothetical protein Q9225_005433 [Loekoesia sp. 1 TL-2023]
MNKRIWKQGEEPSTTDQSSEKPPGDGKPRTELQRQSQDGGDSMPTVDDVDYTPAVSGEGLEMIGGLTGWWEEAWDEQHQFQGFMRPIPLRDSGEVRSAIERALVETVTLAQEPRRLRRLLKNKPRPLDVPTIGDFSLSQADNGRTELRWKRQEDAMELRNFLESCAQKYKEVKDLERMDTRVAAEKEMQVGHEEASLSESEYEAATSPTAPDVDSDHPRAPEDWAVSQVTDAHTSQLPAEFSDGEGIQGLSDNESAPPQAKESIKSQYTGLQGNISLAEPEFKFSVLKRVMQLTGIRISDPAIQGIKSSRDLYNELIQKPKPKKLAQILIETPERSQKKTKKSPPLTSLPNVKVLPIRYKPYMAESALGRKKVIERRLGEYGIEEPFKDEMERIEAYERKRLMENSDTLDKGWQELDVTEGMMEQNALEQPRAK